MTARLRIGDIIRFAYRDPIHGRFEVVGEITLPVYGATGTLERVHVAVGRRCAVIEPSQIIDR